MAEKKPKITLASIRLLCEIDKYVRQYDVRGYYLYQAASDVLDGSVNRSEIDDLVRHKLLTIVYDRNGRPAASLCGDGWTVGLTARAMTIFWPGRGPNTCPA